MPIRCEIVSQDRLVYEGDVDMVVVPGTLGEMGILPGHAPLLSALELGVIRVKKDQEEEVFTVTGGFIVSPPGNVTIIGEAAGKVEKIEFETAPQGVGRGERMLGW